MEAKKIIDSGKMGKLLWLSGVYGKAGSIDYDKNWRNFKNILEEVFLLIKEFTCWI